MEEKEEIYEKLKKLGEEIEKLGFGCIIVDNPFRARNKKDIGRSMIITQPDILEESLSKEEFDSLYNESRGKMEKMFQDSDFFCGIGPIVAICSLASWFDFLDKKGIHPVLSGDFLFGSSDIFLSKVVFGEKRHRLLIEQFQTKYGPNFIQDCYDTYIQEDKRKKQRITDLNRELQEEVVERKKPFSKFEVAEIKSFLVSCVKTIQQNEISAIIGIDCSGRPLVEMLCKLLEKIEYSPMPFFDFLDPHQLRKKIGWIDINRPEIPDVFTQIFEKEFPQLSQLIKKDYRKILVVDDQVFSYSLTFSVIQELVREISGKKDAEIFFKFVSGFNGYNGLTWWKNKSLLRIRNNEDRKRITLKAVPKELTKPEEAKIREFEERLESITEKVFQKGIF